nr:uncharacterized protein LOC108054920 isoform X3 [Drosophila takahashii]
MQMPHPSENFGEDSTTDSRGCVNIPKMELLKVNYVHQCKNAIMYRSSEPQLAERRKNPTRFGGYRRSLSQLGHKHQTGPTLSTNCSMTSLSSQKPPIVDSWKLLLQPSQNPGSMEMFKVQEQKLTNLIGIKSRADRIARIETIECRSLLKSDSQNLQPKAVQDQSRSNQFVPFWLFKNERNTIGSNSKHFSSNDFTAPPKQSPHLKKKKIIRVHTRKQYPITTTNMDRSIRQAELPEINYRDESYDYKSFNSQCEDQKCFLSSCSDSDVSVYSEYSQHPCKHYTTFHTGDFPSCQNKGKPILRKEYEGSIQIKTHGDPNDLQNFLKKNLTKATTNELLKAASENEKKCNIEIERRLIDLKISEKDFKFNDSEDYIKVEPSPSPMGNITSENLVRPNGNYNDQSKIQNSSGSHSVSFSSCSGSCLNNSSVCDSEEDFCDGDEHKYSKTYLKYFSKNGTNAMEGVFRNNAYDDFPVNKTASCCCNMSCCDEDDCSFFDENVGDSIPLQQLEQSEVAEYLTRNKILLLKTEDKKNLKPKSTDSITSLISSWNLSPVPETGELLQNQQDVERRRLRRGHVLKELLETERIYVHEMSSILKQKECKLESNIQHI